MDLIKNIIKSGKKESKEDTSTITFFSAFDKFVKEYGTQNNWTESTYKKFKTVKNHLMKFDENI